MKWFIAKIVFHININHGEHESQFDESVRLVEATSLNDAFHKARSIGKKEETTFFNKQLQEVQWKFIDVCDVYPLDNLRHGSEVFAFTHVDENHKDYIQHIRHKAIVIQNDAIILS